MNDTVLRCAFSISEEEILKIKNLPTEVANSVLTQLLQERVSHVITGMAGYLLSRTDSEEVKFVIEESK